MGVALGLTNLYVKRLAKKGFVKITTIPSHGFAIADPARICREIPSHLPLHAYSLSHYRDMRARLRDVLSRVTVVGGRRLIFGTANLPKWPISLCGRWTWSYGVRE